MRDENAVMESMAPVDVDPRAALLGFVAGMRTQLPLAMLAYAAREGHFATDDDTSVKLLREPAALPVLALSAAGELVVDKLPFTPSRLDPGPLFGRLLFGGLAGAAISREAGDPPLAGALLGAAGAGLGAFVGYHARRWLGEATGIPDPFWGSVEDVAALAIGALVIAGDRDHR